VYQRTGELIESLIELARRQLDLARRLDLDVEEISRAAGKLKEMQARLVSQRGQLAEILKEQKKLGDLVASGLQLLKDLDGAVAALDRMLGTPEEAVPAEGQLRETMEQTDELVKIVSGLLQSASLGLPAINIDADDAMATALVQRMDLMNERGRLADDWRQIKLSADDLKSVLDFNVTQSFTTEPNKPVKFSFDNSQTRLGLTLDLPLNRRAERNQYRLSLIAYQAGRRNLMALEDSIKFNIRSDLRDLNEARIQYPISVTRAALAAEQVISVRLQLALGIPGIRSLDLLAALQSSRESLNSVADARIGYIIDRARFTLALELMKLDESSFWKEINDPHYQPEPDLYYPDGAGPAYGDIPSSLILSEEIKQLLHYPLPGLERRESREDSPGVSTGLPGGAHGQEGAREEKNPGDKEPSN